MKAIVSVFIFLFSVSALAGGWVDFKLFPTKIVVVPEGGSTKDCSGETIRGPFGQISTANLQYNGTGSFYLSYISMKVSDPVLYRGSYNQLYSGSDLAGIVGSPVFSSGETRKNQCPFYFGDMDLVDDAVPFEIRGEIVLLGTEVEKDGTQNVIRTVVPVELVYEGK